MTAPINKYLIEGLDFTGKSSLVSGIQQKRGHHAMLHFSKPIALECYNGSLREYQERSFKTMFSLLRDAKQASLICDRAHLGECVYAPLYRSYTGDYVFDLEKSFGMGQNHDVRLILLVENFKLSKHFIDDGESFDITKRKEEQELFIQAFNRSIIPDKRIICVTGPDGQFRPKEEILDEALAP